MNLIQIEDQCHRSHLFVIIDYQENSAQKEVDDLIQEMKIMQEIGSHPNVVTILGVCTEQGTGKLSNLQLYVEPMLSEEWES